VSFIAERRWLPIPGGNGGGAHEAVSGVPAVGGDAPFYFSANGKGKEEVKGLDTRRFPVDSVSWEDAVLYREAEGGRFTDVGFRVACTPVR
jgi:hypothetical protein